MLWASVAKGKREVEGFLEAVARHAEGSQNLEFTRKIILEMTQAINDLTIEITPRGP